MKKTTYLIDGRRGWLCVCLLLISTAAMAGELTLTGTATYRERMALPPDAVFEATLEDVSRADAPATVIGRARLGSPGEVPIRFSIPYDDSALQAGHRYVVRARILRGTQLMFTTDTATPVTPGQAEVSLLLRRADASVASAAVPAAAASASTAAPPPAAAADAPLINTYWKVMSVGDSVVTVAGGQREPHLILKREESRVTGFGGCNRLLGSYTVSGDRITFSQMAGTMAACPQGMEAEKALHQALLQTVSWHIDGERLQLLDAVGKVLATFESRYLQ